MAQQDLRDYNRAVWANYRRFIRLGIIIRYETYWGDPADGGAYGGTFFSGPIRPHF